MKLLIFLQVPSSKNCLLLFQSQFHVFCSQNAAQVNDNIMAQTVWVYAIIQNGS